MCFFRVFFRCLFGVWKREKTSREARQKENFRKISVLGLGRARAIYSPSREFRGGGPWRAVVGSSRDVASKASWFWKDIGFLILKRCGTWKSNGWIKSYGSLKFAVRQSVHHPDFRDISAILTLISIHEQSLEQEFNNIHNGFGFNPFW